MLRVEAALLPPLKRVPTCGPCTFNVTTQEHGSVFALCESCFDVSVMLDGAARGRIQWDHPRSNGTTTVGLAKGHPMVSRLRLDPLPGWQVPPMAVTEGSACALGWRAGGCFCKQRLPLCSDFVRHQLPLDVLVVPTCQ